jgi:hypothetical protein
MAFSFSGYCIVGAISVIRNFGIFEMPWIPGTVSLAVLVVGNCLEMFIALALVHSRNQMNMNEIYSRGVEDDIWGSGASSAEPEKRSALDEEEQK